MRLAVAPVSTGCTVDVRLNGASIFTITAPPTVPAGSNVAVAVPDVVNLVDGDYLTVDVTTPDGADIVVAVMAT